MTLPPRLLAELEEIGGHYDPNPVSKHLSWLMELRARSDPGGFEYKQSMRCISEILDLLRNPRGLQDLAPASISSLEDLEDWQDRLRGAANQLERLSGEILSEYRAWKKNL